LNLPGRLVQLGGKSSAAIRKMHRLTAVSPLPDIPYYMEDENFAWDDGKAARNWRDHGVTFEMARDAFGGSNGWMRSKTRTKSVTP
jgi:hypothetical protein